MPRLLLFLIVLSFGACNNAPVDHSSATADTAIAPPADESLVGRELELVFSDDTYQLTGIAKEEGGGLLVSYPRWSEVYSSAVVIAHGPTGKIPYPDAAMNAWEPGLGKDRWVCVQSVYFDDAATPWVLDPAAPKMQRIQDKAAKLVKMNPATGKPDRVYNLSRVLPDTAYANDVRIDLLRGFAYITESKGGGIIVIDLQSEKTRLALAGHPSTRSDPAFTFIIDGRELSKDGKPVKIHSDGIALTPDGAYLYYKPLTDDRLYRIPTEALRNWELDDTGLGQAVEDLGRFCTTDGMIFDRAGNLYLGDLQRRRIVRIAQDHKMTVLLQDDRLIWPDSYAIAEGYLYVSCSQIQQQPAYNGGVDKRTSPYAVYRMKL